MSQSHECDGQVLGDDRKETYAVPRTILFVDDEPSLLEARRLMFEFIGYSVLTAESGEEALEVLRSKMVDAVVIDYEMPGMNGEETAREIRRLRTDLPIILSSGCLSLPPRVFETVDASVHKTRPQMLFDTLEQHLHLLQMAKGVHEMTMECGSSLPA